MRKYQRGILVLIASLLLSVEPLFAVIGITVTGNWTETLDATDIGGGPGFDLGALWPSAATQVQVGLSDGTYVEIVSGLIEGDRVLVEYQASQEQFFGFGGGGGNIIMGAGRMRP